MVQFECWSGSPFSPIVKVKILSKHEIDPGRLLIVRAEISNLILLFVNIYAPNIGAERIRLFTKLEDFLRQQPEGDLIILGGDLTVLWTLHRIGIVRNLMLRVLCA